MLSEITSIGTRVNQLELQNKHLIQMIDVSSKHLEEQIRDNTKNTYDDKFLYQGVDGTFVLFDVSFKIKSLENNTTITVLTED